MILRPLPLEEIVDRRVALELFAGAGIGLAAGGALCGFWYWKGRGTNIAVLGAGDLLTTLVTHHQRRILIAAGNDGGTFTQLLSQHLPLIGGQLDLVLIDPRSSDDVIELADNKGADHTLWLPSGENDMGNNVLNVKSRVQADDGFEIILDPGTGGNWQATVVFNGERVAIVPAEPPATATAGIVISLGGPVPTPERWSLAVAPATTTSAEGVQAVADGHQLQMSFSTRDVQLQF